MKLILELKENERGSPIEFAGAVINHYMDNSLVHDDYTLKCARESLAAIAEHIRVFLKHNTIEN